MTVSEKTFPAPKIEAPAIADLPDKIGGDHTYTDHAADNARRASFAAEAVKTFGRITLGGKKGIKVEEPETAIKDLLGDLRHLCDALGLDFDDLNDRGAGFYDLELRGAL